MIEKCQVHSIAIGVQSRVRVGGYQVGRDGLSNRSRLLVDTCCWSFVGELKDCPNPREMLRDAEKNTCSMLSHSFVAEHGTMVLI